MPKSWCPPGDMRKSQYAINASILTLYGDSSKEMRQRKVIHQNYLSTLPLLTDENQLLITPC